MDVENEENPVVEEEVALKLLKKQKKSLNLKNWIVTAIIAERLAIVP